MKIVVTGGCGFIGSHVSNALKALGHEVVVVDSMLRRTHQQDSPRQYLHPDIQVVELSCQDFSMGDADVIVHLAAEVGVEDSMMDPLRYIYGNTIDTSCMLDMRIGTPKRLVVASSMSVYGDPNTHLPINEFHRIDPASIYGLTKYDQEKLCRLWGSTNSIDTIALRFFNVYGPRQCLSNPYTGVIANFAQRLLNGQAPTVYEDGQQTRDFVYIDDVVAAVVAAALGDLSPDVYNVCTGSPTTIEQMAIKLSYHLGVGIEPEITNTERDGDIRHCIGDPGKLDYSLVGGWSPLRVEEGLKLYCEWLKGAQR